MAKNKTRYVCQNCGWTSPKWQGQCRECKEWNTLVEEIVQKTKRGRKIKGEIKAISYSQIETIKENRTKTKIGELDRVLGGGIVSGSVVLVAGQPGIGKSTLLSQLALKLSGKGKNENKAVLYVCGEESPSQIKLRLQRLVNNKKSIVDDSLLFLPETNVENVVNALQSSQSNNLIIVDSIQTMWSDTLTGSAGSVGQVRYSANKLLEFAKASNTPVFLVGHVTKEGRIAGPKVLEHLVDTVLSLEGEKENDFRVLRAVKNRFGPTDEVGIFRMTDKGMKEIKNPSEMLLGETEESPGSAVTVTMQGIRPMLVEIQGLAVPSSLAVPRRVASGVDYSRLQVIIAVLQKKANLPLYEHDIFVNVAGGFKLTEPSADLAIALAIASSFKNKALPAKTAVIGELGLLGEVRKVSFMKKRIKEAKKMGYENIIGEKEKNLRQTIKLLK